MSISRAFSKVKNHMAYTKFPMSSKFHFSLLKIYFSQFVDKFLKFEKMECLIHHVSLKCGQPYINSQPYFQQWELDWDISFSTSSIDSKLGFWNLCYRLYFQGFPNSQRDRKLGFLNIVLAGLLNFSQFMEEIENWNFWILA